MFKRSFAFLSYAVVMLLLLPVAFIVYSFLVQPSLVLVFVSGIVVGYFLKRNKKLVEDHLPKSSPLPVLEDDEDDLEDDDDDDDFDDEEEDDK